MRRPRLAPLRATAARGLFLCLLLLATAAAAAAQPPVLRVDLGGRTEALAGHSLAGTAYFLVAALQSLSGLVSADSRGATVVLLGDTLRFDAGSPFFRQGRVVHQLAFSVRRVDGALLLPEQFFI
jgi:hypothetical protein